MERRRLPALAALVTETSADRLALPAPKDILIEDRVIPPRSEASMSRPSPKPVVESGPQLPERYSVDAINSACWQHPWLVVWRCIEVASQVGRLALSVALKSMDNEYDSMDVEIAAELRQTLVELGPSFVKIGQFISSRVDLLSPPFISELQMLTDRVQPFRGDIAERIIAQEWHCVDEHTLEATFAQGGLPEHPIAAASLCQVYRMELPSVGDVAVKVQRPGIRSQICIDLFLLRQIAKLCDGWLSVNTDVLALVDEYGERLVDELDFSLEAKRSLEFRAHMARLGLDSTCTAPEPVMMLTTRRVLVSEWIEGEHLAKVADRDLEEAKRLQVVALNTYLAMLLDTGTLHADPHLGNLIRAQDGRLAILDWGLVARIPSTLQRNLMAYFAHVLASDYEAVPGDLVALGILTEKDAGLIRDSDVAAMISDTFRHLASGGSAQRRVADILPRLAAIREVHGAIGQVPAPFIHILRTFSILEGIGLKWDKDYRLIDDCYPYMAAWALRSDNDEARRLLIGVLSGTSSQRGPAVPDPEQLAAFLRGLRVALVRSGAEERASVAEKLRGLLIQVREAKLLREVVMNEIARTADVLVREVLELLVGIAAPERTDEDAAVLRSVAEFGAVAAESIASGEAVDALGALASEAGQQLLTAASSPMEAVRVAEVVVESTSTVVLPSFLQVAARLLGRSTRRLANSIVQTLPAGRQPAAAFPMPAS